MDKTTVAALTGYFNEGDGKRPLNIWRDELQALTPAEKRELAELACAASGWTLRER